jgi:hypothetical protein
VLSLDLAESTLVPRTFTRAARTLRTSDSSSTFAASLDPVFRAARSARPEPAPGIFTGGVSWFLMALAAKLYLLWYDTDLDFVYLSEGSRTRFGFDFSRNITTNLEIHGEWARVKDNDE